MPANIPIWSSFAYMEQHFLRSCEHRAYSLPFPHFYLALFSL